MQVSESRTYWKLVSLLHLEAISEMIPFMEASGQNLYTKSAWLCLQQMQKLAVERLDVYQRFQ